MDIIEKEQLAFQEATRHWYYSSKFKLLNAQLNVLPIEKTTASIADIGCGSGLFLDMLAAAGWGDSHRSIGVDPARNINTTPAGIPMYSQIPDRKFDIVLLMDVLEHVPNPTEILAKAAQHCNAKGFVFITVPALPWLWSGHDRFLGHYRRYTLKSLERTITAVSSLTSINSHYYFSFILPAVIPYRLVNKFKFKPVKSDLTPVQNPINRILKKVCEFELKITPKNKIIGLSAVALCQKK